MNIDFNEYYENKKKNITYEIYNIEGEQYNFKLEDIQKLLKVEDLELFKKYVYYKDTYNTEYIYIENYEDSIIKFLKIIDNEKEKEKNKLLKIFLNHEKLFRNENGIKRLELIPKEYKNRKLERSFL